MADLTEADLNYLRNINTRPGPGVGQSIDLTQPGPTADRIAELERELAACRRHIDMIIADPLGVDQMALGGATSTRDKLSAELSRLSNEQPKGRDAACPCCGGSGYERYLGRDNSEEVIDCSLCAPSPATSPGPRSGT